MAQKNIILQLTTPFTRIRRVGPPWFWLSLALNSHLRSPQTLLTCDGERYLKQLMTENSANNHVCILKTGKLFEHDIAANALKENAIPFYKQMETSSGLRLAMPFQPAMGPGTYYNILVPRPFAEEAAKVLEELPIDLTTEPDIWHFGASEKVKRGWKIYIWIVLILSLIVFLINFMDIFV